MEGFEEERNKRQEVFDIEEKELTKFTFNGVDKRVYKNANLSIFVDDYCNADCKFCVAQLRYENVHKMYCKPKIQSDEEYFRRLEEVLKYVEPLNLSVSITGGEPTKSKRLIKILELVDKYNLRKRTITTNGSGLLEEVNGKTILQHIIDHKFNHLNISKTHYIEEKNKNIMNYKRDYCSNEMLSKIIPYAVKNNLRPRMSCLLLKDGVHTVEEMANYMDYYEKLGIDNVIFRELMDYDQDKMINKEKMNYCKNNKVRLNDVWPEIDKDYRFEAIKNILGYYYYVEIYKYHNITMCSESANLVQLYKEKEKHKDIVYEMVFHPNGNLNGSWVDNEEILLPYKIK